MMPDPRSSLINRCNDCFRGIRESRAQRAFHRIGFTGAKQVTVNVVPGDEILSINSKPLHGMTHAEAIAEFKSVKAGDVVLHVGRRVNKKKRDSLTLPPVTAPPARQQVQ